MNALEWLRSRMSFDGQIVEEPPSASRQMLKRGTVEARINMDGTTMLVRGFAKQMHVDSSYTDVTVFGEPEQGVPRRSPDRAYRDRDGREWMGGAVSIALFDEPPRVRLALGGEEALMIGVTMDGLTPYGVCVTEDGSLTVVHGSQLNVGWRYNVERPSPGGGVGHWVLQVGGQEWAGSWYCRAAGEAGGGGG